MISNYLLWKPLLVLFAACIAHDSIWNAFVHWAGSYCRAELWLHLEESTYFIIAGAKATWATDTRSTQRDGRAHRATKMELTNETFVAICDCQMVIWPHALRADIILTAYMYRYGYITITHVFEAAMQVSTFWPHLKKSASITTPCLYTRNTGTVQNKILYLCMELDCDHWLLLFLLIAPSSAAKFSRQLWGIGGATEQSEI